MTGLPKTTAVREKFSRPSRSGDVLRERVTDNFKKKWSVALQATGDSEGTKRSEEIPASRSPEEPPKLSIVGLVILLPRGIDGVFLLGLSGEPPRETLFPAGCGYWCFLEAPRAMG